MDDVSTRLVKCFCAIFPDLDPHDVARATPSTVNSWDSVASVTLFTLIEEEFATSLDPNALDDFTSFEGILAHVRRSKI